jgi:hypothetical protein
MAAPLKRNKSEKIQRIGVFRWVVGYYSKFRRKPRSAGAHPFNWQGGLAGFWCADPNKDSANCTALANAAQEARREFADPKQQTTQR